MNTTDFNIFICSVLMAIITYYTISKTLPKPRK